MSTDWDAIARAERRKRTLPVGDVIHVEMTGEEVLSHRYVNVGTGRFVVWMCANCGAPRDN